MKKLLILASLFLVTGCFSKNSIKYDELKGTWIALPEYQTQILINGKDIIGGEEKYYLECDGRGNAILKTKSNIIKKGTYKIIDNSITIYDESDFVSAICELVDGKEINCENVYMYAYKYIKE